MESNKQKRGEKTIQNSIDMSYDPIAQKNIEAISVITKSEDADNILTVLDSFKVEVVLPPSSMSNPNFVQSCYIALNLLPRFLKNVRFKGDTVMLSKFPSSHNAKISTDNDAWKPDMILVFGKIQKTNALYVGSSGWSSYLSTKSPCMWENKPNNLAAIFSGALAVGEVFKNVIEKVSMKGIRIKKIDHFEYDLLSQSNSQRPVLKPELPKKLFLDNLSLVGCGAVGQAIGYVLSRATTLVGTIKLIDHENLDESNEQRYLLGFKEKRDAKKIKLIGEILQKNNIALSTILLPYKYEDIAAATGFENNVEMISALDDISPRLHLQAGLPKTLWNIWTDSSEGVLRYGIGHHTLDNKYSCLACEYFPTTQMTEVKMIANRIGFDEEEVRKRIANDDIVTKEDLRKIEQKKKLPSNISIDIIARTVIGKTFRQFIHGDCGVFHWQGVQPHVPTPAPHVPVLAAVQLVTQYILSKMDTPDNVCLLESVADFNALTKPNKECFVKHLKNKDCFCCDPDYQDVYARKWNFS